MKSTREGRSGNICADFNQLKNTRRKKSKTRRMVKRSSEMWYLKFFAINRKNPEHIKI
jgi:hypothetical protein